MKRLNIFLVLVPTLISLAGCGFLSASDPQLDNPPSQAINQAQQNFSYAKYKEILAKYVNEKGLVDYQQLQKNRQQLEQFNASLSSISTTTFNDWSQQKQLAFLLNAYNSFTLQAIIEQEPLPKSIKNIPGVWKKKKYQLLGGLKSLNNIEHDIIRVNYQEPRIHFALVCAAISCPPLRNEPYEASKLDFQLEDQVRKFLSSSHGFIIKKNENKILLSSIFKWYGKDWLDGYKSNEKFAGNINEKAILNFATNYLSPLEKDYLKKGAYEIKYLDYDWSLNQR